MSGQGYIKSVLRITGRYYKVTFTHTNNSLTENEKKILITYIRNEIKKIFILSKRWIEKSILRITGWRHIIIFLAPYLFLHFKFLERGSKMSMNLLRCGITNDVSLTLQ